MKKKNSAINLDNHLEIWKIFGKKKISNHKINLHNPISEWNQFMMKLKKLFDKINIMIFLGQITLMTKLVNEIKV
jgi:hypothetical protein